MRLVFRFSGSQFEGLSRHENGGWHWTPDAAFVFYTMFDSKGPANKPLYGMDGSVHMVPDIPVALAPGPCAVGSLYADHVIEHEAGEGFAYDPLDPQAYVPGLEIDWYEWLNALTVHGMRNVAFVYKPH
jgi:hypothetical protein